MFTNQDESEVPEEEKTETPETETPEKVDKPEEAEEPAK